MGQSYTPSNGAMGSGGCFQSEGVGHEFMEYYNNGFVTYEEAKGETFK